MRGRDLVTLFLCGDVMLGRGVDQILPHPGDPALLEPSVRDARVYVELAEAENGPIPRPVGFTWPWGDALQTLETAAPDVRVINLETSVTRSGWFAPNKFVHYRMNPANVPSLVAGRPDVCALANNHILDFGYEGLEETLATLAEAKMVSAGAGPDLNQAQRPAIVPVEGGRVLVFSFGTGCSGIEQGWAATPDRPGVAFVPELSDTGAAKITERVRQMKRPEDIAVVSIHWGSNWGYGVSHAQTRFAHALIDGGVDVVHGHSSHHPRPMELYGGKLILYGCGDFIDDYEGIAGYERYRDDLRLLYLASVQPRTGMLADLKMIAMQSRHLALRPASLDDVQWLTALLNRISRGLGVRIDAEHDGTLVLNPT
ncbi:CapA family protein [Actinomadura rudentiformis]|uniref:CapA family protein n=1 Tax=Actinomadura rudentiformis TaxID=359158 RepID=A0A6H9YB66_9ACTN|nr:CapA family protein [Actinomadura rudentiformis]KAB2340357.1 CapA family protein [Actinomadura rudentiformis]